MLVYTCASCNSFREARLIFIRSNKNKIYNVHDQVGTKLLTRVRLGFSHLCEHKF